MDAKNVPITISINGKECLGEEVSFEPIIEPWCKYKLENGMIIRAKLNVLKILRGVDEKGEQIISENGEPLYLINHRIDLVTSNID